MSGQDSERTEDDQDTESSGEQDAQSDDSSDERDSDDDKDMSAIGQVSGDDVRDEPSEEGKAEVKKIAEAYSDKKTAVMPGTDRTITGTAVNEWLDDEGNPKFGDPDEHPFAEDEGDEDGQDAGDGDSEDTSKDESKDESKDSSEESKESADQD